MTTTHPSDEQSEARLRQKIIAGSQDPNDYLDLATLLFEAGRYEEAVALYDQGLRLPLADSKRARMHLDLGWLFCGLGKLEQAITQAEKAREFLCTESEKPEVLFLRGIAESLFVHCLTDEEGRANAARLGLKWLNRLMAEAPDFEDITFAYIHAARLNNVLGNSREAVTLCKKCLEKDLDQRDRLECLNDLADSLRIEKRFAEAEHAVVEAINYAEADKEKLPKLYFTLGVIQRSADQTDEAQEAFQKALESLQAHPYLKDNIDFLTDVYWNLGELYYESEMLKDALEAFDKILGYHPNANVHRRSALLWLGYCYEKLGDPGKAAEYFRQVLALPDAPEAEKTSARKGLAWNLGKLYYESRDLTQAAAAFEEVLRYQPQGDPDRLNTLVWLGHCYFEAGQDEKAAVAFKESLPHQPQHEPNHWNTMLRLGHAYFGRDYQKARECYESVLASPHAAEADKDSARKNLTRSLANLYYEAGKYGEAAAAFEEVLSYYPDDVSDHRTALLWLGYSYQAMRAYDQAIDCFEKVLASTHASEADKASAQQGLARLPQLLKKTLH